MRDALGERSTMTKVDDRHSADQRMENTYNRSGDEEGGGSKMSVFTQRGGKKGRRAREAEGKGVHRLTVVVELPPSFHPV